MANASGNRHHYGDIRAEGQSNLHLGDVNISNIYNLFAQNADEAKLPQQKPDILVLLRYENMHAKRDYSMPEETFNHEWIWSTPFDQWLRQSNDTFWTCGKPGSGKSTLMAYLSSHRRTLDELKKQDADFKVLHFFYDYRAGTAMANTIDGMLRSFLYQLASTFSEIKSHLESLLTTEEIVLESTQSLFNVTCQALNTPNLRVCAFIDGLDEYDGNHAQLMQICKQLVERTRVKLCVASRPDVQVSAFLTTYATISMQDYNRASMEAYIDAKILQSSTADLDFQHRFVMSMREELVLKAEGIILWFKLACDETVKLYESGGSDEEVHAFIDELPLGLEPMYERILSLIVPAHREEAAMLLYMVKSFRDMVGDHKYVHSTDLDHLWGAYDFIHELHGLALGLPKHNEPSDLQIRIRNILRGLVEIYDIEYNSLDIAQGMSGRDVRFVHKSFYTFIQRADWTSENMNVSFKQIFPDFFFLRLSCAIIERIDTEQVFAQSEIDKLFEENNVLESLASAVELGKSSSQIWKSAWKNTVYISSNRGLLFVSLICQLFPRILTWHFKEDPDPPDSLWRRYAAKGLQRSVEKVSRMLTSLGRPFSLPLKWQSRREILRTSMILFISHAKAYEHVHGSSFPIIARSVQSRLNTILCVIAGNVPDQDSIFDYLLFDVSKDAELKAILDMIMAVSGGLEGYIRQRLDTATLTDKQLTFLGFASMLACTRGPLDASTAAIMVQVFTDKGGTIEGKHICALLRVSTSTARLAQLARLLVPMLRDSNIDVRDHYADCDTGKKRTSLLMDFVTWRAVPKEQSERNIPELVSCCRALLDLLLAVGIRLEGNALADGPVLRALLTPHGTIYAVEIRCKFMALMQSGLDPSRDWTVKGALEAAQSLRHKVKKRETALSQPEDVQYIIKCLQYWEEKQQWPDEEWVSSALASEP